MKKGNLMRFGMLLVLVMASVGMAFAAGPKTKVKKASLKYEMVQSDGTNASAVAWNSKTSQYTTVIAGNEDFPFEIFSTKGKSVKACAAGIDWRGLWFNPETGAIEGNGAGELGWATVVASPDGGSVEAQFAYEGQYQPDFQSVGTLDYEKGQVVFFDPLSGVLALYNRANPDEVSEIALNWDGIDIGNINATSVGYTGVAGYEFVLLDYQYGQLLYFDRSGKHTATTKLPASAPLNDMFAFSFANGTAFLYDKDARVWYGYKVF